MMAYNLDEVDVKTAARLLDWNDKTVLKAIYRNEIIARKDNIDERAAKGYSGLCRWNVQFNDLLQFDEMGRMALDKINALTHDVEQSRESQSQMVSTARKNLEIINSERDQNAMLSADKKFLISQNEQLCKVITDQETKTKSLESQIALQGNILKLRNADAVQQHTHIQELKNVVIDRGRKNEEITGQFHERGHIIERLTDRCMVLQTRIDIISRRSWWKRLLGIR